MNIQVMYGDALQTDADVLVLKYAQSTYGVDELVVERLEAIDSSVRKALPKAGGFQLFETRGQLAARTVLFVGVVDLRSFEYEAIREFAHRALASLAKSKPDAAHVAFTLHGAGYGLDESEAFRAELAGIIDAIESRNCPAALESVTIVERSAGRARRLQALLEDIQPASTVSAPAPGRAPLSQLEPLRTAGVRSQAKPHVFVAMPFAPEFDDHFHYGIQQAVNTAGYLCERADLATFTGDVIVWVKERIDSARLLVADLSTANPNVYLEVGYAWGKGIPTVLLARDEADLKFDVKGQRCLVYSSIRKLEELLTQELARLR
jgi:hypothetical protein